MSDQNTPVEICTDATAGIAMLSCVLPNSLGLMRSTCSGLTTIRVGKKKFPRVKRLAVNISGCGVASTMQKETHTHSRAPFFQIQMYPTIRMARKISISINPNMPSALNFTAHGNRKIVSTSNTTNRMATI